MKTWKQLISLMAFSMLLLVACKSSKKTTDANALPSRNAVKGDWVLNQISYEGLSAGEKLRFTLLDEGAEDCLKGSNWHLPNNGNGYYSINTVSPNCNGGQKNIVWSYREENKQPVFQYKRVNSGTKAKDVAEGYRFRILTATGQSMVLQSEISYQGNPIRINYSFSKASK